METLLSPMHLRGRMVNLLHPRPEHPALTGDQSLDRFVQHMMEALHFFENVDPFSASDDPRKPYFKKADQFLYAYAGMGYQDLKKQVPTKDITEEDYALATQRIRPRLFDFRARLYLAALDSCDQEGIPIPELLPKIRDAIIPPIKKEAREPTFEILLQYLTKS